MTLDQGTTAGHGSHDAAHEHELAFWRKYIFSTDHKVIGIQYGFTSLFFLFFGFMLMMLMRWQLAYPGEPVPGLYFIIPIAAIGGVIAIITAIKRSYLSLAGVVFLGLAGVV